jgi:quercetin dioxygenase-like cupin family protein
LSGKLHFTEWLFNLHNEKQGISRALADGISARVFVGKNVMLSVVKIEPNSQGKIHSHPQEQWGVMLEGECIRIQGDKEVSVKAGDFWHTPTNVPHGIRTESASALVLDIFSPPRQDYKKLGEGFGQATVE